MGWRSRYRGGCGRWSCFGLGRLVLSMSNPSRSDTPPEDGPPPAPPTAGGFSTTTKRVWAIIGGVAVIIGVSTGSLTLWDRFHHPRTSAMPKVSLVSLPTHVGFMAPAFVIPKRLANIPAPPVKDERAIRKWALRQGGADANFSQVSFTIRGTAPEPTLITDVTVRVTSRRQPVVGTVFPSSGAGPISVRFLDVNLDSNPPKVKRADGNEPASPKWSFPLRVSNTDAEVFAVIAGTERYDCTWVVDIAYSKDGVEGVQTLTDGGHPFRTTATLGAREQGPMLD